MDLRRRELALALGAAGLAPGAAWADAGSGDAPVVAPIRVYERRVTIQVRLAGRGPYRFGIDTGAGVSTIDEALARTIPELSFRQQMAFGGLGGRTTVPLYDVPEMILGDSIRQRHVVLAGSRSMGSAVQGLLASGVFTTYDSDLDFEAEELRVWPDGRRERPGYAPVETEIEAPSRVGASTRIIAAAEVDGRKGRFLLDTGAPRIAMLSPSAGRRWGYWRDDLAYAPVRTAGFGGADARLDRIVRVGKLKIADIVFERPLVTLHNPADVDFGPFDGIIGLDALMLTNLSIDTRSKTVWLKRNGRQPLPEGYSRSGVWLDEAGPDASRVAMVGFGSPGATAGLKVGDLVVSPPGLKAAVAAITGPPGQTRILQVRSGGDPPRTVTLTLGSDWL